MPEALVLDGGGLSTLAERTIVARERLRRLRNEGLWPPIVSSAVLSEALTGDHRKDFNPNRLLAMCDVVAVEEAVGRRAAYLRTAARRGSGIDAIVIAMAEQEEEEALVLTQDVDDLAALSQYTDGRVRVRRA